MIKNRNNLLVDGCWLLVLALVIGFWLLVLSCTEDIEMKMQNETVKVFRRAETPFLKFLILNFSFEL